LYIACFTHSQLVRVTQNRVAGIAPLRCKSLSKIREQVRTAQQNNVPKFERGSSLIHGKVWLGDLDSNQDSQIQSLFKI